MVAWHLPPGIGCPVPDIGNVYLVLNNLCIGYCCCIYPPSKDVSIPGFFFEKQIAQVTIGFLYYGPRFGVCFKMRVCVKVVYSGEEFSNAFLITFRIYTLPNYFSYQIYPDLTLQ